MSEELDERLAVRKKKCWRRHTNLIVGRHTLSASEKEGAVSRCPTPNLNFFPSSEGVWGGGGAKIHAWITSRRRNVEEEEEEKKKKKQKKGDLPWHCFVPLHHCTPCNHRAVLFPCIVHSYVLCWPIRRPEFRFTAVLGRHNLAAAFAG